MLKAIKSTAIVLSLTLGISGFLPIANIANHSVHASDYIGSGSSSDEYTVIATYYLSAEQAKGLADNIEFMNHPGWDIASFIIGIGLPPMGQAALLAAALGANATQNAEITYAAKHNMRLKVEIKDKVPHTSYSQITVFTAVY